MRIALPEGEVHYVDQGSGPPILFVHGTPTHSFEYRHLIAALSPRFRCIAPDHLGFGQSSRPQSFAYTPEAHARVLKRVRRASLTSKTSPWWCTTSAGRSDCRLQWEVRSWESGVRRRDSCHPDEHLGLADRRRSEDGARRTIHRRRDRPVPLSLRQRLAAADHAIGLWRSEETDAGNTSRNIWTFFAIATRACSCCTRSRRRCSDRARTINRCSIASSGCGPCRS